MRLFRQKRGEDWADIVPYIAKELAAVAQGDHARLTPFKAEGERRATQAAAIMAAEAVQAAAPIAAPVTAMPPGQALIVAEQKRRN
jgi:hypothetical protein